MADEWYEKVFQNKHEEINQFLESKKSTGKSPRTLNSYSRVLRKFYHEHFPELTPAETQVYHIEKYVNMLSERDLSQNTKRKYVENVSAFFAWSMKRPRFEDITGNPAAVVLEDLPKEKKERPDCATWDNARKIVQNIHDPRDKTVAIVMAKTGARVKEVLRLERDDLMLEEGFVRFSNRKGGRTTVNPVDVETIHAIQRCMMIDDTGSELVFSSIYGNELGRERIRRSVRAGAVDAGIMEEGERRFHKKFTSHTFRTVFTTLMRNSGMPDYITRYLRGDGDREVMDLYTRIDRQDVRQRYLNHIKTLNVYRSDRGENH